MKLKDICADIEEYLENRCYCPGEIYDRTGIFCQIFKPDDECKMLLQAPSRVDKSVYTTSVICRTQIITFWTQEGIVTDAERYDATENNIKQIKAFYEGKIDSVDLNEFESGATQKTFEEMSTFVDAILIS